MRSVPMFRTHFCCTLYLCLSLSLFSIKLVAEAFVPTISTKTPAVTNSRYQKLHHVPNEENRMLSSIMGSSNTLATTTTTTTTTTSNTGSRTQLAMSTVNPFAASSMVVKAAGALIGTAVAATGFVKLVLDRPSRTYGEETVGAEYDAWTTDGILEYYWGEHIHLGYYYDEFGQRVRKNFIQAKYDFIDEMMKFGNINPIEYKNKPIKVLDVGCGFGGTSRYLAKALGSTSEVTGITLSQKQVERGTELAHEQGVATNTKFLVMNALDMTFDDNTFDIVWACESGEHMPEKKAYIDEMMRVLKPGGKFVMACWSQRDDSVVPFDARDKRDLQYLYEEWSHPYFISVNDWTKLIVDTGVMTNVKNANWVNETIPSWRHSVWVGIEDPRGWIFKVGKYMKCVRDGYCLERMHRAFKRGLMEYGMFAGTKLVATTSSTTTTTSVVKQ